ncbi:beta-glucan synthesis-associated [Vararia minispora EC-137]|uniref:Beta-glucan synthesis-associated n=1 Tax=Vararia minispora EC-137 TaxID=1314806 RepID=A0ACB8QW60_9AGAM|nr:beta-glucan synthesis-associated [Vararia minispora EC-137]
MSSRPFLASDSQLSPSSSDTYLPVTRSSSTVSSLVSSSPFARNVHSTVNYASLSADTPYPDRIASLIPSAGISNKFALPADPRRWGSNVYPEYPEPDDHLHNPDAPSRGLDAALFSPRGIANIGCLLITATGILTLFAGYPIISYFTRHQQSTQGAFGLGGTNLTGQVPEMSGNWGLIDPATPQDAYTKAAFNGGDEMDLIFSDEFNVEGRTFYPGDDPYWEAVDLHYWQTNNLEWYDPAAITTKGGALVITLSNKVTHGLNYQGGMMSTWNKFCFTGGLYEASVTLPGANNVVGLWPAVWAMGNLGRAGYGASLDGMWPYSYDACDVGTVKNQTVNGQPEAATVNGDPSVNGILSYLPGQRLSRCTCSGESHPGPVHSDGTYVGRSAPEIDVLEAQVGQRVGTSGQLDTTNLVGTVSQSGQWAPFDAGYIWKNTSDNLIIYDPANTVLNTYIGGKTQQATSGLTNTNQQAYELNGGAFSIYGFEYRPGFNSGYITWISDNKAAWTLNAAGMGADSAVQISARPVPQEPMYLIVNLGISQNFGTVDFAHLTFPTHLSIDWIRVYQRKSERNVGCDPPDFPTMAYIEQYAEAYANPNLTTWTDDFGQPMPKNKFLGQC